MRMFCPAFAYVFKVFFHQLAQKANIAKRFPSAAHSPYDAPAATRLRANPQNLFQNRPFAKAAATFPNTE
jgi:hypothetical protein